MGVQFPLIPLMDNTTKLNDATEAIGKTLNLLYRAHCSRFDDEEMGENYTLMSYEDLLNLADEAFGILSDFAYDERDL